MRTIKVTVEEMSAILTALHSQLKEFKRLKSSGADVDDLIELYERTIESLKYAD